MNYLRAAALEVAAQALNHSCTKGADNADFALRRSPIQQNPPKFHAFCGWMAGAPLILPFTACNATTASAAAACRHGCVRAPHLRVRARPRGAAAAAAARKPPDWPVVVVSAAAAMCHRPPPTAHRHRRHSQIWRIAGRICPNQLRMSVADRQ